MNKRLLAGVAAAGIIGGGVYGFAASLNGVDSDNLGADDAVVASCDTDGIDVSYTTVYNETTDVYDVATVELSDVDDACDDETIKVTLSDEADLAFSTGTQTADASGAASVDVTNVDAESVEGFHVVISG